jgi:hypothetical protein
VLVTFFASPDSEQLLLQDVTSLQSGKHSRLLAIHIPYYVILRKHSQQQVRMYPFRETYSCSAVQELNPPPHL